MKKPQTYMYVRPPEVARRLGVSPRTLYRMEQRGEVPKRQHINGLVTGWLPEVIEPYFAERERTGATAKDETGLESHFDRVWLELEDWLIGWTPEEKRDVLEFIDLGRKHGFDTGGIMALIREELKEGAKKGKVSFQRTLAALDSCPPILLGDQHCLRVLLADARRTCPESFLESLEYARERGQAPARIRIERENASVTGG